MIKMETKDRIVQLLEDIVEKAHHINSHPEKELCLELDLVMEDLRSLYREYANLKKDCQERHVRHGSEIPPPPPTRDEPGLPLPAAKTSEASPAAEKPSEPPVETPEAPPVEEPTATPPPATESPATENFASQRVEDSPEVPAATETPEAPPAPESPKAPAAKETPEAPPAAETPPPRPPITQSGPLPENNSQKVPGNATRSIGEQFPADNNSLHQRISKMKEDRSIGARMQQHPISNIKDAIGVNEKFLFINELFNGNIQAYHEAIATLNSLGSVQAAFDHLNELNMDNKWDAERSAATIEKLANFVQRRYMNK